VPAGKKLAVIGAFAKTPRFQGAGSSLVNPIQVTNAYDELVAQFGAGNVVHAEGCDGEGDTSTSMLNDAVQKAAAADVAIVFAGLPESYESEGFDRRSIDMPPGQVQLIEAVAQAQPNLVVVLLNGSAVAMRWANRAKGIVEAWLGGQAGGGAIADVLSGRINPSGKLAETFPVDLEQTPTFPHFPGRDGHALYGEGVFVGYRHYDTKRLQPLFPFGFGLSYTRFAYTGIRSSSGSFDAEGGGTVTIEVTVKNIGAVAGQEVVQLYVHEHAPAVVRPEHELRAFDKLLLQPGEAKTLSFTLSRRDFAYYDARASAWSVHSGTFQVRVGGSSRDLPLQVAVEVQGRQKAKRLTTQSLVRDFKGLGGSDAHYAELVRALGMGDLLEPAKETPDMSPEQIAAQRKARMATFAFVDEMPVNKLPAFSLGRFTEARLDEMLRRAAT
jgi:beta-glucosidase